MELSRYGSERYGYQPYGNGLPPVDSLPPWITGRSPSLTEYLGATTPIVFSILDDVDVSFDETVITINGSTIYVSGAEQLGYRVTVTDISHGYTYSILPPVAWPYASTITIGVLGQDTSFNHVSDTWSYAVEEHPDCFTGPLTAFETALVDDYAAAPYRALDITRRWLLDYALTRPQATRAARWLFLQAHDMELGAVLRDLVPAVTTAQRASRICGRRSNITIAAELQAAYPRILEQAIPELQTLKLNQTHAALLYRYATSLDAELFVSAACIIVCLGQTFAANILV